MNFQKGIVLVFILILLTGTAFTGSRVDTRPEKAMSHLSQIIETENVDELRLTIYYISPEVLTLVPLDVNNLLNMDDLQKIIVNGDKLKEHIDLLQQMSHEILTPVKATPRVDARNYYVFETKQGAKILSVTMWGIDGSIFVNGVAVKEDNIFYQVIMPFAPEDLAKGLSANMNN